MIEVNINISKQSVFSDVGRLTHYTGDKKDGDANAFERISTTPTDESMLSQFWQEACEGVTEQLKPFVVAIDTTNGYMVSLSLSSSYDTGLTDSVIENIRSCLTLYIVSRWYILSNREDSERYSLDAANQLSEAMRKIYYKKKPSRRTPGARPSGVVEKYYAISAESDDLGSGTASGGGSYKEDSTVTLIAKASSGRTFSGWYSGGILVSEDAEYSFTVKENKSLTAMFAKAPGAYTVTLEAGTGIKRVTGGGTYDAGTAARITAETADGYVFKQWEDENGDVWFTDSSVQITLPGDITLRASGEQPQQEEFRVELERGDLDEDTGGGSVTGGGSYRRGATAILTATPNANSKFLYWLKSDGTKSYDNPLHLTVDTSTLIWYYFKKKSADGGGDIEPTCFLTYGISPVGGGVIRDKNDIIRSNGEVEECLVDEALTLHAVASSGYHFVKWVITDAGGSHEYTNASLGWVIGGNTSAVAYFAQDSQGATASVTYETVGGGEIWANGVNPGSGDEIDYTAGTVINLTATAQSGYYIFDHWEIDGINVSSSRTHSFTASGSHNVKCYFAEDPSAGTVQTFYFTENRGSITVNGHAIAKSGDTKNYLIGTELALEATAKAGYAFDHWEIDGATVGTSQTHSFTVSNKNHAIRAVFLESASLQSVQAYSFDTSRGGMQITKDGVTTDIATNSSTNYPVGTILTLLAIPITGYIFDHWRINGNDTESGTSPSRQLLIQTDSYTITPVFTIQPDPSETYYSVELERGDLDEDTGAGTVSGAGEYASGSNVILTATPNSASEFDHWFIDGTGTSYDNPLTLENISENKRVWYYFRKKTEPAPSGIKVYVTSNVVDESGGYATITVGSKSYSISSSYKTAAIDYAEGMIMSASSGSTKTFSKWQYSSDGINYTDVSNQNSITVSEQTADCYYKIIFN